MTPGYRSGKDIKKQMMEPKQLIVHFSFICSEIQTMQTSYQKHQTIISIHVEKEHLHISRRKAISLTHEEISQKLLN